MDLNKSNMLLFSRKLKASSSPAFIEAVFLEFLKRYDPPEAICSISKY